MGDISVSALLSGGYEYLGRPDQSKLNLGQALAFLLDSIDFYLVDLLISDENFLLKQYTFTPSRKDDDIVTAPGFSVPVLMEIRDASSTSESDWRGILTANASDIQDLAKDGTRAVAFYGSSQTMMRWTFDPVNDYQVQARLWYEPTASQPSSLSDSPKLSQAFSAMLKIRWARSAIPYCGFTQDEAKDLFAALTVGLNEWREKWNYFVNSDKNARPVQKRDFRGGRKYARYPGGRGVWW
jgi:hypothetical protein